MSQVVIPASYQEDLRLQAAFPPWKLLALIQLTFDIVMEPRRLCNALRLLLAKLKG